MVAIRAAIILAFCPAHERDAIIQTLRKSDQFEDQLARDQKRVDRILAETRARGYGTRDPGFIGGIYRNPTDDGLAGIAVRLLDCARVHGSIMILWIAVERRAKPVNAARVGDGA